MPVRRTGRAEIDSRVGAAESGPVRLHVAAKRYLCAVEPGYYDQLSEASRFTLTMQGGPMSAEQAGRFAALPYAGDAVALRRWDERAKDPQAEVPGFPRYRGLLLGLIQRPVSD
ncbi:hypothetical protein [Dactylosporangium sp. CA-139066]|uniref:hypothetical protein n=1 Tax=Dactylosporangium sp. CA-139066 TaxID=3239930 RepID=UPI003D8BB5AC